MKAKLQNDDPVTKGYLDEKIENDLVTKDYLDEKIKNDLVTKDYLDEKIKNDLVTKDYLDEKIKNDLVTKDYLDEKIKNDLVTKDYLDEKIKNDLVTKDYLNETLNRRFDKNQISIDAQFERQRKYVESRLNQFKIEMNETVNGAISRAMDKFYTRIDPILAEVENSRVDRELRAEQDENVRKKLQNHETRIQKLEEN